jgi:FkbM family methyltransferase
VHPDDRVVELGAGIGFVAAFVATRCRPASYLAIEADPSLTDLFHRTLALNGIDHGVDHLNKAAIGGGSREARFSREGDFFASHVSEQGGLAVPTVDLNQVIADRQATILIVDIEGGETTLFDELMLDGVRAVCMEIHPQIGTAAVLHLFGVLGDRGFAYDGRLSSGTVVTFMRQISA